MIASHHTLYLSYSVYHLLLLSIMDNLRNKNLKREIAEQYEKIEF